MTNIRIEVLNKCEQVGCRWLVNVYSIYIHKELPPKLYEEICGLFYNKVIQDCRYYSYNENLVEVQYDFIEPQAKWGLEISFLPGMTDNVGNTAKQIVREYFINKGYIDQSVIPAPSFVIPVLDTGIQKEKTQIPASRAGMTPIEIKARSSKLILGKGSMPTEDYIKQEFNPITEYCTLICKENNNYSWKYYGKCKSLNTHSGVIPARDQEKKEWIPVSSTGMTKEGAGMTEKRLG